MEVNALLKLVAEGLLVEERIRILELLVEPVLHLLHTLHDPLQVRVTRQHDDGSISFPRANGRRGGCAPTVLVGHLA